MPNLKPHTVGYKAHLIEECVKMLVNSFPDKNERIAQKDTWDQSIMTFFLERTTYAPKYVKANYLEAIRYRCTLAE